jgi:hypothetical protein
MTTTTDNCIEAILREMDPHYDMALLKEKPSAPPEAAPEEEEDYDGEQHLIGHGV